MFRKILVISLFVLICILFSGYFYCADRCVANLGTPLSGEDIKVIITNRQGQNFVSESELAERIKPAVVGKTIEDLNINALEDFLCGSSAICKAQAYVQHPSTIVLEVTQRNPVVRFQNESSGFYCDSSGYILPLLGRITLDLPIVGGKFPFKTPKRYDGYPESGREWLLKLIHLSEAIRNNPYWSREVEQIWVENTGDVVIYTRSGNEKFIFGSLDDSDAKLTKMAGYYRTIKPKGLAAGKHYTTVNLKYRDQIICK